MGKSSPKPPPTPDYNQIAMLQGQANKEAAQQSAYMSNPNIYTPTAQQTVTWNKTPQFNEDAFNKAMTDYQAQVAGGNEFAAVPTKDQFTSYVEQPTIRQELTGAAKDIFATQQQAEQAMALLGLREIGDLNKFLGQDFQAQLPQIKTALDNYGQVAQTPNLAAYGQAGAPAPGAAGTVAGAPSAGDFRLQTGFNAPGTPGEFTPTGTATSNVSAFGTPDATGVGAGAAQSTFGGFGGVTGTPNITGMGQAGTGGMAAGAGLPGQVNLGAYGQAAAGVTPTGTTAGPSAGAYGLAGGGPAAYNLGSLNLSGVGGVQGGPSAGQYGMAGAGPSAGLYGMAAGGPAGVQFGGLDTSGLQGVQGGVGQFGTAQGGPAGLNLGGFDASRVGELGAAPSYDQFGRAIGGPAAPSLTTDLNLSGVGDVSRNVQEGRFGYARGDLATPELQRQLATQNLAAMPVNAGMSAQNAIMSRLDPQLQRERAQLEQRLVNQGLRPGGEAYNAEMELQAQRENDLRTQAALQGIGLDAQMRQQGLSEQQTLADFANQAALAQFGAGAQGLGLYNQALSQNFQQSLAAQSAQNMAQQQAFQQRLQAGQFGQEAQMASFGMGQQAQQATNQAQQQNFERALAAQQAQNAAQAQGFGQQMAMQQFGREGALAGFETQ